MIRSIGKERMMCIREMRELHVADVMTKSSDVHKRNEGAACSRCYD
jgi:hypothetical protein